jgi:hypothetical protein
LKRFSDTAAKWLGADAAEAVIVPIGVKKLVRVSGLEGAGYVRFSPSALHLRGALEAEISCLQIVGATLLCNRQVMRFVMGSVFEAFTELAGN